MESLKVTHNGKHLFADSVMTRQPNFAREVATLVHKGQRYRQAQPILKAKYPVKQNLVQLGPGRWIIGPPRDDTLFNPSGFFEVSMSDDLIFHAVVLGVHAGGQHQHPVRQLNGCPALFQ